MLRTNRMWVVVGVVLLFAPLFAGAAEKEKGSQKLAPVTVAKSVTTAKFQSLPVISADYRLGVNDVIDVHVWKERELSRVIPVRPDGKISLPLAGELVAEGRTALELGESITQRLKTYVAAPEVTVMVQQINSQRYFVMGEVQGPGTYPLTVPTTVMQALSMAGGFREFADTGKITIIRRTEDNRTMRIKFSYKAWVKSKKVIEHVLLRNGDIIVVP